MSIFLLVGGNGILIVSWVLLVACGCFGVCRSWIGSDATAAGVAAGAIRRGEESGVGHPTRRETSPAARRCHTDRTSHFRIERHSFANYRGCLE